MHTAAPRLAVRVVRRRKAPVSDRDIRRALGSAVRELGRRKIWPHRRYLIQVVLAGAGEARRAKRRYLSDKRAPNVLSFDYGHFGEILLSPEVIAREARRESVRFGERAAYLLVHAAMHLAGIHHEQSRAAAERAERLEAAIAEAIKIRRSS